MNKLIKSFCIYFTISTVCLIGKSWSLPILSNNNEFTHNLNPFSSLYPNNMSSNDDYPTIIKQASVHLSKYPGKYLQPDGTFLFQVPTDGGRMYRYEYIEGTNNNDHIRLKGKLIINKIDMLGGNNTLTIEANSEIRLDPGFIGKPMGLELENITNFNIQHGVKLDKLKVLSNKYDVNINFSNIDSSKIENETILKELIFNTTENSHNTYLNINNAKVIIRGNAILSHNNDNITLKDAQIDKDGKVDIKTLSTLVLDKGLSNPGGNNTLNMGKFSTISIASGSLDLNGNSTINMKAGTKIKGSLILRNGTSIINIEGYDKDKYKEEVNKVSLTHLSLSGSYNILNIRDYANFSIDSNVGISGSTNIFVGKESILNINGNVGLFSSNNTIYLDELSEVKSNFKFSSVGRNNSVVVNTGNTKVTLDGSFTGSKNSDTFMLLGKGVFYVNSQSPGQGIDGFNVLNLGQSRIEFSKHAKQSQDTTVILSIFPQNSSESNPRLQFNGLAYFNNTSINMKYKGVTQHLGKVGNTYNLTLLRVGAKDSGYLKKLEDIGLKEISFQSALYKLNWKIKNDSDLILKLEKYRTFKEAVGNKEDYYINEAIVEIASFLDRLVDLNNLSQKYYDMLDDLAMIGEVELKQALKSFIPINNTVLFNMNKNLFYEFKDIILNSKPYKISKNDISLWTQYGRTKLNISNNKGLIGGQVSSSPLMGGAEYSVSKYLKIGGALGYTKSTVCGNNSYYKGNSSNTYYGVYGISSITKDLNINLNLGIFNSSYDLNRTLFNGTIINGKPQFKQKNVDVLLSYKLKVSDNFMFNPFITFGYNSSYMKEYSENGEMGYKIDKSNFREFISGIGIKSLLVQEVVMGYFIPSINLGIYNYSQKSHNTNAHILEFKDINESIVFHTQNYGGIVSKGEINFSYNLNNGIILDLNMGAKLGKLFKSYNIGAVFSITL